LRYGAETSQERERALAILDDLITLIPAQPLSIATGETYGAIRLDLERSGMMIGNSDLWIAAHARSAGLTLVTNNARDFRRVPGLALENWAERPG
jgi:tRNA(fMet)-specific endonuclease VapC